jgi:hypothetical protein
MLDQEVYGFGTIDICQIVKNFRFFSIIAKAGMISRIVSNKRDVRNSKNVCNRYFSNSRATNNSRDVNNSRAPKIAGKTLKPATG